MVIVALEEGLDHFVAYGETEDTQVQESGRRWNIEVFDRGAQRFSRDIEDGGQKALEGQLSERELFPLPHFEVRGFPNHDGYRSNKHKNDAQIHGLNARVNLFADFFSGQQMERAEAWRNYGGKGRHPISLEFLRYSM